MKTFRHKRDNGVMMKVFQIEGNPITNHVNTKNLITLLEGFVGYEFPEITMRSIVDEDFDVTNHSKNQIEYMLHVGNAKISIKENDWIISDWDGCVCVMSQNQIYREFEETDDDYHLYDGIIRFK